MAICGLTTYRYARTGPVASRSVSVVCRPYQVGLTLVRWVERVRWVGPDVARGRVVKLGRDDTTCRNGGDDVGHGLDEVRVADEVVRGYVRNRLLSKCSYIHSEYYARGRQSGVRAYSVGGRHPDGDGVTELDAVHLDGLLARRQNSVGLSGSCQDIAHVPRTRSWRTPSWRQGREKRVRRMSPSFCWCAELSTLSVTSTAVRFILARCHGPRQCVEAFSTPCPCQHAGGEGGWMGRERCSVTAKRLRRRMHAAFVR